MASNYPASLDALSTSLANSTVAWDVHPQHHDDLADAVNKIEATLGVNPWFNVKKHGAVGDGSTDDTTAIQDAITACIAAGGGTVLLPAGTYKTTGTLDFSALAGTLKQVTFKGAGSGGMVDSGAPNGATILKNTSSGTCLKAYATNSGLAISGLRYEGFTIQNTVDLGSHWAIDWDGVYAMGGMRDVVVQGSGTGVADGNGIRICNPFNGQLTFENVIASNFKTGVGIRVSTESTTAFPGGVNSGNCVFNACMAVLCSRGWHIYAASNVLNGCTFNACKAVGAVSPAAAEGFYVESGSGITAQHVFNSPHSEDHLPGIMLVGCEGVVVNSPLVTHGANPAGRGAIEMYGSNCTGNVVVGGLVQNFEYGVWFRVNANNNQAVDVHSTSSFSGPAVTTLIQTETGANAAFNCLGYKGVPPGTELVKVTNTSNTSITATTEGTAQTVFGTVGPISTDGVTPVLVEVWSPKITPGTTSLTMVLKESSTVIGWIGVFNATAAGRASYLFTPSAASHTYTVVAFVDAGTGTVAAGTGGTGATTSAICRITRA